MIKLLDILKDRSITEGIEDKLSSKYQIELDIYEFPTHIELKRIVVPEDIRGQGIGTSALKDLIDYAESINKPIFTTPSSSFGGSESRLTKFYKSFGFKPNSGSNRDFRSRESMVKRF
jgi:GNAT superfamily N-acetyltransferase